MVSSAKTQKLTKAQFTRLSEFIYREAGINLTPVKIVMLESRLARRLKATGIGSFDEYIELVTSQGAATSELIHMLDVVTTNKTDFFREPNHYTVMNETALPELMSKTSGSSKINIWSAGCSSGEEPYTLAMVMEEFFEEKATTRFYEILGTDLSTEILQKGVKGIYPLHRVDQVPMKIKQKYFLKSKDHAKPTVRLIPKIRNKVKFGRLNFMAPYYDLKQTFDIVFCRNVIIYFDRKTQEMVLRKIIQHLKPGGYFFLGHSESINEFKLPLTQIKPTVFVKE